MTIIALITLQTTKEASTCTYMYYQFKYALVSMLECNKSVVLFFRVARSLKTIGGLMNYGGICSKSVLQTTMASRERVDVKEVAFLGIFS